MAASIDFRRDINGLRAYAVAAVVLYHFGVPGFAGGFVGVDVFFVISGFLMTGIIVSQLEAGRFSLLGFYLARAARIIPALAALCAAVLVFGWFWLTPVDYQRLGRHVASSIAFLSNVTYATESGYFDTASHEKWLLHTWSLSVEWQFYLLLPLALIAWRRWVGHGRAHLLAFAVLGVAVSLGLSVVLTAWRPTYAFYLLPTRAWELLAGGAVFLVQRRLALAPAAARLCYLAGLASILVSVVLFHAGLPWPGAWAALPVAGAALVLLAQRQDALPTAHPWIQWIGTASYSIYLWHWPIAVGARYFGLADHALWAVPAVALSLLLGGLSYHWVEVPTRSALRGLRAGRGVLVHGAVTACVAGVAAAVLWAQGVPARVPREVELAAAEARNRNPRSPECLLTGWGFGSVQGCHIGAAGRPERVVMIGDSHAGALLGAIDEALTQEGVGGRFFAATSCPPVLGMAWERGLESDCRRFYAGVEQWLKSRSGLTLVLVGRWSNYLHDRPQLVTLDGRTPLDRLPAPQREALYRERVVQGICRYAPHGSVHVLAPIPEMPYDVPRTLATDLLLGRARNDYGIERAAYARKHGPVLDALHEAGARCGAQLVDPTGALCDGTRCRAAEGGRPLYFDDDHLSEYGNRRLAPLLRPLVRHASPAPRATTVVHAPAAN